MKKIRSILTNIAIVACMILCGCQTADESQSANANNTQSVSDTGSSVQSSESETTIESETMTESETVTEETEPEVQVNVQKKRAVWYDADGSSYVYIEYEYDDNDNIAKETYLNNDGSIASVIEYTDDTYVTNYYSDYNDEKHITKVEYGNPGIIYIDNYGVLGGEKKSFTSYVDGEVISIGTITFTMNEDGSQGTTLTEEYYAFNDTYADPYSGTHLYEYDENGRLTYTTYFSEFDSDIESAKEENGTGYTYNENGYLTECSGYWLTEKFLYNDNGAISEYTCDYVGIGQISHYKYSYDEHGRCSGWTSYNENDEETYHCVVEYDD